MIWNQDKKYSQWCLAWGAKLPLFRDDMISYLDNSVELTINAIKTNKS